ncbi:hypothetical protein OB13_13655 [Pontibacter sp. HJ8]
MEQVEIKANFAEGGSKTEIYSQRHCPQQTKKKVEDGCPPARKVTINAAFPIANGAQPAIHTHCFCKKSGEQAVKLFTIFSLFSLSVCKLVINLILNKFCFYKIVYSKTWPLLAEAGLGVPQQQPDFD